MTGLLGTLVTFAEPRISVRNCEAALGQDLSVVFDSGAWSVFTNTRKVDVDQHSNFVMNHQRPGVRYVGLDVIGDGEASYANWKRQRDAGAPVEPTLHYGEPPSGIDRYLADGLATPWINLGGLVPHMSKSTMQRRVASWCAAVRTRCPDSIRIHGLGCTNPTLNRWFPFDAIDSTYWLSPVRWYRNLPLFDPRSGAWKTTRIAHKHPGGRAEGWEAVHRWGPMLREHYGVDPIAVANADNDSLLRLTIRSHALFADYWRKHHGTNLKVHLAGAGQEWHSTIKEEA